MEAISDLEDGDSEGNNSIGEERGTVDQKVISCNYARVVKVAIGESVSRHRRMNS